MKVEELLNGLNYEGEIDNLSCEISSLTLNSKEVIKGSVFFALNGNKQNGNNYILEALKNGAVLVISDEVCDIKNVIKVKNIRSVISKLAYKFYKPKKNRVKVIGVVGTNGKTSTTFIIKEILSSVGKNVGVIGTLGIYYNNKFIEPFLTTPDAIYLYETLKNMANDGVEYAIIELSAHAIEQKRAQNIKFEALIFTNCTHDHLDYFKTFNEYKNVKASVFNKNSAKFAVVNADDELGREIIFNEKLPIVSYGVNEPSDVFAVNISLSSTLTKFVINSFDDVGFISTKLLGDFNVSNILSAITTCQLLGVSLKDCVTAVNNLKPISGRLEYIESYNGADIFVDYAHTPDGLKNVLLSLKKICKNKLTVVFGCGGNRDKAKRSEMGKIAGEYADFTVITTDNPRYEEPYSIIREIEKGIREKSLKYITVQNRYMATGYAISKLKEGDVLVICGKGAEKEQEVMGVKLSYNDGLAVRDIIAKLDFGGELI